MILVIKSWDYGLWSWDDALWYVVMNSCEICCDDAERGQGLPANSAAALPKMSGNKDANWLKFHSLLDIHGHREIRPAFQPERHLGACSRDLN
jgi:hypothetical protein